MKLIALDLDGTLLNSEKVISAGNFAALSLAAEQGHVIVPATGRALRAIPEQVMALPFLRYAITINGAKVSDTRTGPHAGYQLFGYRRRYNRGSL